MEHVPCPPLPAPETCSPSPLVYLEHMPHSLSYTWNMCPTPSGAAGVPAVTDTAQALSQRVACAVSMVAACNPLKPFPPLTANLCPHFAGLLHGKQGKHGRHKCWTRPPLSIPTQHGTHSSSRIPTRYGTHRSSRIPTRHETHSPKRIPTRHVTRPPIQSLPHDDSTSHETCPHELTRPLPPSSRGRSKHRLSTPSRSSWSAHHQLRAGQQLQWRAVLWLVTPDLSQCSALSPPHVHVHVYFIPYYYTYVIFIVPWRAQCTFCMPHATAWTASTFVVFDWLHITIFSWVNSLSDEF